MQPLFKTKTKIVGTLGPTSANLETIEKMLVNGLTVARLNMSHGDHESHGATIALARKAAKRTKRPLAILQDLAGPKIRIGDFETEEVKLIPGKPFVLTTKKCIGTVEQVYVNYEKLPKEVAPGMHIYLNDGKQKLLVEKVTDTKVHTTIVSGGNIRGRRGVNIPEADLSIPSLTNKDKKDLKFGLSQNVDFVTLSFVRTADDIQQLKKLLGKDSTVAVVAKIETRQAIENLEAIVEVADVIMVARGDLAIETPLEKVPLLQKKIIRTANYAGKPVITATQMLDSMRIATTPTRAEVADIANAILDGTDALMLSDETAIGQHPELAVEIMSQVAIEIEQDDYYQNQHEQWKFPTVTVCDAVTRSIARSVKATGTKVIAALSESGHTARMIARHRPDAPILVLTPHQPTYNKMLIVFGCEPVIVNKVKGMTDARKIARRVIASRGIAKIGETFILGAGIPFGSSGTTNTMMIERL
jgi:pyruvate kinase